METPPNWRASTHYISDLDETIPAEGEQKDSDSTDEYINRITFHIADAYDVDKKYKLDQKLRNYKDGLQVDDAAVYDNPELHIDNESLVYSKVPRTLKYDGEDVDKNFG